jgi:hypothetical protein
MTYNFKIVIASQANNIYKYRNTKKKSLIEILANIYPAMSQSSSVSGFYLFIY